MVRCGRHDAALDSVSRDDPRRLLRLAAIEHGGTRALTKSLDEVQMTGAGSRGFQCLLCTEIGTYLGVIAHSSAKPAPVLLSLFDTMSILPGQLHTLATIGKTLSRWISVGLEGKTT